MIIEDDSGVIALKLINTETGDTIIKEFNENIVIEDIYNTLYNEGFLNTAPEQFSWFCESVADVEATLKSYSLHSGDELKFECQKKISCTIIAGGSGATCDIDIPVEATVGDVIAGLIKAGFLDADISVAPIVFYDKRNERVYKDSNMTIEECGWTDGQILEALYYAS